MGNRFLKGAMILSISMFATKFLGILYVIPFQQLVGTSGMALYNYAYTPYQLLEFLLELRNLSRNIMQQESMILLGKCLDMRFGLWLD